MSAILNAILAKFIEFGNWLLSLVKAVFTDLWELATDLLAFLFDTLLGAAVGLLSSIDTTSLSQYTASWGSLPSQTLEVLAAIGLAPATGIVLAAIGIRLVLQLIPFVRLGS